MFSPSPYQQAIFDWIKTGTGNACVNSCAGSGKTTTCEHGINLISESLSVRYLVFNKKNALEAETRITRPNTAVSTFHSCCFAAWKSFAGKRVKVDPRKLNNLVRETMSDEDRFLYGFFAQRLVAKAKTVGIPVLVPDEFDSWEELAWRFDITLDNDEADWVIAITHAMRLLEASTKDIKRLDFDDMLYLPLVFNCAFEKPDWLFVDEAQDCTGVQIELLRRMVGPHTRFVAIGDPYQAIYGFRGAESSSMANISKAFDCTDLPLTVSFRCPRAIIEAAREFAPNISAHESAPEGAINSETFRPAEMQISVTSAILCRNTAPLISAAYSLIRNGRGCKVLGRDIGAGLIALIKKMNARNPEDLYSHLSDYMARETAKFRRQDRDDKIEALNDKVGSVFAVMDAESDATTIDEITSSIKELFKEQSENGGLITLSTVHKAKGLEWPHVYILNRFGLMPSKYATQDWQIEQENNLIYVAYTRAKEELTFLEIEKRERKEEDF